MSTPMPCAVSVSARERGGGDLHRRERVQSSGSHRRAGDEAWLLGLTANQVLLWDVLAKVGAGATSK